MIRSFFKNFFLFFLFDRALWLFVLGTSGIIILCCYSGLVIYASYHDCDPLTTKLAKAKDQLLPLFVMKVFENLPGLPGLFVAGIFSASLRYGLELLNIRQLLEYWLVSNTVQFENYFKWLQNKFNDSNHPLKENKSFFLGLLKSVKLILKKVPIKWIMLFKIFFCHFLWKFRH